MVGLPRDSAFLTPEDSVTHGGGYPAGAGVPHPDDEDFRGAAERASQHAGDSGDTSMFANVLGHIGQKKQHLANQDIDEEGEFTVQHSRLIALAKCTADVY
jgi:hypothetical protein